MSENRMVSAMLTQEQLSFLEDFESRSGSSADPGIPLVSIIRCLLKLFEDVQVDVRGIRTEDELFYRLLNTLKAASYLDLCVYTIYGVLELAPASIDT